MGCFRLCAVLVPVIAVLGPIGLSAAFDGKFWDLLTTWDVTDIPDLSGKVAIVTGPTVNGIGFESTVEMSRKGAQVILAGRSEGKGQEALKELLRRVPDAKADFMKLDLSSLKQVKEFAMNFKAKRLPLHILMNNAGIMANPFSLTVDKLESQFATNHLGHFLLTKLLLPELEASAPARVVTVTSAAAHFPEMMAKLEMFGLVDAAPAADFDKLGQDYEAAREAVSPSRVAAIPGSFCQAKPLQLTCRTVEADYHPFKAYARSKLANVLFTRALARRLSDKHIFANSCHPGGIMTNLPKHVQKSTEDNMGKGWRYYMDELMQLVMLTPPRGAVTQLYLASSPEIEEKGIRGQYFRNQAIHANPPKFSTEELEEKLWNISEKLVAEYL